MELNQDVPRYNRVYAIVNSFWYKATVVRVSRRKVDHIPYFNSSYCWFVIISANTCPYTTILKMWQALEDDLGEPFEISVF